MRRSKCFFAFLFAGLVAGLWPAAAWACPVCELGGRDTAVFIVTVFGCFAAGMLCFLAYFLYRGGFKDSEAASAQVLAAEDIKED